MTCEDSRRALGSAILHIVCEASDIDPYALLTTAKGSRIPSIMLARRRVAYLMRACGASDLSIATTLNRDVSTISNYFNESARVAKYQRYKERKANDHPKDPRAARPGTQRGAVSPSR